MGDVGEYSGDAGQNSGDVGEYSGDAGQNSGDVGARGDDTGYGIYTDSTVVSLSLLVIFPHRQARK